MDKVQENQYAQRRLINEQQAKATRAQRVARNPERFKRIVPTARNKGRRGG